MEKRDYYLLAEKRRREWKDEVFEEEDPEKWEFRIKQFLNIHPILNPILLSGLVRSTSRSSSL